MRVTIEVTQECIDHGVAWDCDNCPVARAICKVVTCHAAVSRHGFSLYDEPKGRLLYDTGWDKGSIVPEWTRSFDRQLSPVKPVPFNFPFDIPDQYLRPEVLAADPQPAGGSEGQK